MAPYAHALLPASSAHRWLECPGSVRLCEGVPHVDTVYNVEGSAAHELGEWCLTENCDAASKIGKTPGAKWPNGEFIKVTPEMAEAVQVYLDNVRATSKALIGSKLIIEHKFRLDWVYPNEIRGKDDCIVLQPFGRMAVKDYKHGVGVQVYAKQNPQLMIYGLGALGEKNDSHIEDIELEIIQPRAPGYEDKHPWLTTPEELYDWANNILRPGAKLAMSKDAPLKTGDHCKFCPALATCPAVQTKAMTLAGAAFKATPLPSSLPATATMTTDQLERVYEASGLLSDWARAAEKELKARLERGEPSNQYKIVAGKANREWVDQNATIQVLKQHIDPWHLPELLSPAQAEDRMKQASVKKQDRERIVNSLCIRRPGRVLAHINDRRAALPAAGACQFTPIIDIQATQVFDDPPSATTFNPFD